MLVMEDEVECKLLVEQGPSWSYPVSLRRCPGIGSIISLDIGFQLPRPNWPLDQWMLGPGTWEAPLISADLTLLF